MIKLRTRNFKVQLVFAGLLLLFGLGGMFFGPSQSTNNSTSGTNIVSRVVDGDTVVLKNGETVRYIGINTPELGRNGKADDCFAVEATRANESQVLGKEVRLEKDVSETDRYGRLLRYVYVDEVLINEYLVKNGYAYSSTYQPDVSMQDIFEEAEEYARQNNLGLWSETACDSVKGVSNTEVSGSHEPACNIKGNISFLTQEKIYHMPSCKQYDRTRINEKNGEQYFCSEEEAIAAGWRKALGCN